MTTTTIATTTIATTSTAQAPVEPAEAAAESAFRNLDVDREEGIAPFRGLMFGTLLSLPMWGLIAGVVFLVRQAFTG